MRARRPRCLSAHWHAVLTPDTFIGPAGGGPRRGLFLVLAVAVFPRSPELGGPPRRGAGGRRPPGKEHHRATRQRPRPDVGPHQGLGPPARPTPAARVDPEGPHRRQLQRRPAPAVPQLLPAVAV